MLTIPDECLDISVDAIGDITEVGAEFKLLVVKTLGEIADNKGDNLKDMYSSIYGQNKRLDEPEVKETFTLHAVGFYDPTTDQLKGTGLVEKSNLRLMTIVYEYMKVGYCDDCNDFHDFITKLKRNCLVEFNGKRFFAHEVAITGVLNGFGIVCNLGCDVYG